MIVTGYRSRNRVMGQLSYTCDKCQQKSYHTLVRTRRFFTVFWIPVIPLAKITTTRCNVCGFQTYIDNKKADELLPQSSNKEPKQA
jgi:ribosomal protein L37E